jgi:sulfonate transport system substrate-binding protein
MKRMILAITVLALLVASGAALSSASAEIRELNITYVKAPLNIPSIVQKRMELFEKEFGPQGITVGHPEITAGPKQTQAMAAGSVDFANCVGGTSVLIAASQGLDIRIIGIYGRSPKAFTLLVNDPGVKSLADLKGKKIAVPRGRAASASACGAQERGNGYDDVQHIEMGIPTGRASSRLGGRRAGRGPSGRMR